MSLDPWSPRHWVSTGSPEPTRREGCSRGAVLGPGWASQVTPSPSPQPPTHAHGAGQARQQLSTVPARGAVSQEFVLQELEIQAQPVPGSGGDRRGEAELQQPPSRTVQSRTGSYGQGLTWAASPLWRTPLGAMACEGHSNICSGGGAAPPQPGSLSGRVTCPSCRMDTDARERCPVLVDTRVDTAPDCADWTLRSPPILPDRRRGGMGGTIWQSSVAGGNSRQQSGEGG